MKIAICVSGQTRKADTSALVKSFDCLKDSFDIDFYGHTWTDQVAPSNINDFKNFQHTDQDEIWHEFKGDIFNMIPFNQDWNHQPEYIKLLNGNGNFSEFAKSRVNSVFGQIVSNYKCIKQINASEYDAIIKWRWDSFFVVQEATQFIKDLIDFISHENIHNKKIIRDNDPIGVGLNMRIGITPGNTYIEDRFFLFRKSHIAKLSDKVDVYQSLRNVYLNNNKVNDKDQGTRLHSHALWVAYFIESNIQMLPCLTDIAYFCKISRRESLLNKKWNN